MTDKEDKTSLSLDSDKNLLILAAKAAGYVIKFEPATEGGAERCWRKTRDGEWKSWNPLTSNDDCFRLETALQFTPFWYVDGVSVDESVFETYADHGGDKDKARRYASTRAAALIGRE